MRTRWGGGRFFSLLSYQHHRAYNPRNSLPKLFFISVTNIIANISPHFPPPPVTAFRPAPAAPSYYPPSTKKSKKSRKHTARTTPVDPDDADLDHPLPAPSTREAYSSLLQALAPASRPIRKRLRASAGHDDDDDDEQEEEEEQEEEQQGDHKHKNQSQSHGADVTANATAMGNVPNGPGWSTPTWSVPPPHHHHPPSSPDDVFERHYARELTDAEALHLTDTMGTATTATTSRPRSTSTSTSTAKKAVRAFSSLTWDEAVCSAWGIPATARGRPGLDDDNGVKESRATTGAGGALVPAPNLYDTLSAYGVKDRCAARWHDLTGHDGWQSLTQQVTFALVNSYRDVLLPVVPYPRQSSSTFDGSGSTRGGPRQAQSPPVLRPTVLGHTQDAVLLHIANHVAKSADLVRKNNAAADAARDSGAAVEEVPRDQGFVRPRVLVLAPQRNIVYVAVRRLLALLQRAARADTYQGLAWFDREFGDPEDGLEDDDHEEEGGDGDGDHQERNRSKTQKTKEKITDAEQERERERELDAEVDRTMAMDEGVAVDLSSGKPVDHQGLFGGNTDDLFKVGLRVTKGSVRILSRDVLDCDIVFASPLAITTESQTASQHQGEGTLDWLSSVEILVVLRADVMQMQNWSHVQSALELTNRLPELQRCPDIMRVREWALAQQGRLFRQTIVLSSFASPEQNALISRWCANHQGAVQIVPKPTGILGHVRVSGACRQLFERVPSAGPGGASEDRFTYFTTHVWPRWRASGGRGRLLFVPSYYDYVRLRNFLHAEGMEAALASEYETKKGFTRARTLFFQGKCRVLLYTERAHFYHRFHLRGVREVFFYALPEHAAFYAEVVNLMEAPEKKPKVGVDGGSAAHVHTLFTKWDVLALQRVVGASRATRMMKGAPVFLFD